MEKGLLKADAATMNAILDTLAAVVMCVSHELTAERKMAFATNLARLAANAEAEGNPLLEVMLIDMFNAAQ